MRFIHTADWQIGRTFGFVDEATQGRLHAARLDAISTIGALAETNDARTVLVAGDVYDQEGASDLTLRQVLERMRRCEAFAWHLLPGNHDPHVVAGPWDRVMRFGPPCNVVLHLEPRPAPLGSIGWLLPAPLRDRRPMDDPTAWMDGCATPQGALRIGLAHGSVTGFGLESTAAVAIAPDRAGRAGLEYLALGDWHGRRPINPRCGYSGTPEPDRFDQPDAGTALLVEVAAAGAVPVITPLPTATFVWRQERVRLQDATDLERLEARLRGLVADPQRLVLALHVAGALSLADRAAFEQRIRHGVGAALGFLRLDDGALETRPSVDDLDAIAPDGVLRLAAQRLQAIAAAADHPERHRAARALVRLQLESRRLGVA